MEQSSESGSSGGMKSVSADFPAGVSLTCGLGGMTAAQEVTRRAGSMTSSIGKWLKEEKSFETTGVGILLSVFFAALLLGLVFGQRLDRLHRHDTVAIDGKLFEARGFVVIENDGRKYFVPFYEEAFHAKDPR